MSHTEPGWLTLIVRAIPLFAGDASFTLSARQGKKEVAMICMRCQGFMVGVPPLYLFSTGSYSPSGSDQLEGGAWQCVNCGEYLDEVILANRALRPSTVAVMS